MPAGALDFFLQSFKHLDYFTFPPIIFPSARGSPGLFSPEFQTLRLFYLSSKNLSKCPREPWTFFSRVSNTLTILPFLQKFFQVPAEALVFFLQSFKHLDYLTFPPKNFSKCPREPWSFSPKLSQTLENFTCPRLIFTKCPRKLLTFCSSLINTWMNFSCHLIRVLAEKISYIFCWVFQLWKNVISLNAFFLPSVKHLEKII